MMARLLFLNQSREIGGTDTFLISLIKAWPRQDEINVWSNRDHKGLGLYKNLEVNLKIISFPTIPVFYEFIQKGKAPFVIKKIYKVIIFFLKPFLFLAVACVFYKKLKKEKFDAIFSNNGGYPGGEMCRAIVIAAKLAGVKKIFLIIHNKPLASKLFFRPWAIFVDRLISACCAEIISVSRSCVSHIESIRYFNRKVKLINYGIDLDKGGKISFSQKREVLGLKDGVKVIGCIGNYEKRKGHDYLIMAFAEVKKAFAGTKLIIIGSDVSKDAKYLHELVNELKLQEDVKLTGYLEYAREYIECFDVLAMPSVAYESFGLVLLEAMFYKKPVIGTSVDGIPEAVEGAGLIVEPAQSESLAQAIIYLLNSPEKCRELGEIGFNRLKKNFSSARMASDYCLLIGG